VFETHALSSSKLRSLDMFARYLGTSASAEYDDARPTTAIQLAGEDDNGAGANPLGQAWAPSLLVRSAGSQCIGHGRSSGHSGKETVQLGLGAGQFAALLHVSDS